MSQINKSNEQVLQEFKTMIMDCAGIIKQYSKTPDDHFNTLKEVTKEVCEVDFEYQKAMRALNKTRSHFESKKADNVDMKSVYENYFKNEPDVNDVEQHNLYNLIERECSLDNDRSLLCSGSTQSILDPITKMPIKVPCRNVKCKHMYDYETITVYINSRQNVKAQCPYIGCKNKNIALKDLDRSQEVEEAFSSIMNSQDKSQDSIINITL